VTLSAYAKLAEQTAAFCAERRKWEDHGKTADHRQALVTLGSSGARKRIHDHAKPAAGHRSDDPSIAWRRGFMRTEGSRSSAEKTLYARRRDASSSRDHPAADHPAFAPEVEAGVNSRL